MFAEPLLSLRQKVPSDDSFQSGDVSLDTHAKSRPPVPEVKFCKTNHAVLSVESS